MISIITINYNNAIGLKKTIKSVVSQSHKGFEYIVIDGNSTDGSKEVIEKYKTNLTYSISEPDTGVYNAMNKGIKKSKGDYLLFLNSGDVLVDSNVLNKVVEELDFGLDIYYGNLIFKSDNTEKLYVYPDKLSFRFFYEKSLPHPATFIKRELFNTIFYYNEKLKIVSDWEFFIVALCKYNVNYKHLDITISVFETEGMSSLKDNRKQIEKERLDVLTKYFPLFTNDIKSLQSNEQILNQNRFRMLKELETSRVSQKLNSVWLRILLRIVKNKNVKDL
ncbi:MAG: glycosyltransferase [Flavobacteriaceae bacterium]|nr:glycosyltransferase [Flavobacteriaceae bacterium]